MHRLRRCVIACPIRPAISTPAIFTLKGPPRAGVRNGPTWEYSRKWPRQKFTFLMERAKMPFLLPPLEKRDGSHVREHLHRKGELFRDLKDNESLISKVMRKRK